MMKCYVCNSDRLLEGNFATGHGLEFFAKKPKHSFPYFKAYSSKLDAIACKDCGTLVQVKLQNLDDLKKFENS